MQTGIALQELPNKGVVNYLVALGLFLSRLI